MIATRGDQNLAGDRPSEIANPAFISLKSSLAASPRTRLCRTDGVACHRVVPCRVSVGEEGRHPLPHPVQPFRRSRRGEHGIDERPGRQPSTFRHGLQTPPACGFGRFRRTGRSANPRGHPTAPGSGQEHGREASPSERLPEDERDAPKQLIQYRRQETPRASQVHGFQDDRIASGSYNIHGER